MAFDCACHPRESLLASRIHPPMPQPAVVWRPICQRRVSNLWKNKHNSQRRSRKVTTRQTLPVLNRNVSILNKAYPSQQYPPQNQQYQQPMVYNQQPQQMYAPQVMMPQYFGSMPQMITCQYCGTQGFTIVHREAGLGTWLVCAGVCLVTGCLGPIAFCIDGALDANHHCATCGRQVGLKKLV